MWMTRVSVMKCDKSGAIWGRARTLKPDWSQDPALVFLVYHASQLTWLCHRGSLKRVQKLQKGCVDGVCSVSQMCELMDTQFFWRWPSFLIEYPTLSAINSCFVGSGHRYIHDIHVHSHHWWVCALWVAGPWCLRVFHLHHWSMFDPFPDFLGRMGGSMWQQFRYPPWMGRWKWNPNS